MSLDRFYFNAPLLAHQKVILEGEEFHHLAHVMRCRPGHLVTLINGRGARAEAELLVLQKQHAELLVLRTTHALPKPPKIILGLALLRSKKMEWIVEKGTELGADAFWIFTAERSEKEELRASEKERLHQLIISAMKQSDRLFMPEILYFSSLQALPLIQETYFGDLRPHALSMPVKLTEEALFVTGPESGFSPQELQFLDMKKARGVRINANLLRAETAPVAAMAILRSFS